MGRFLPPWKIWKVPSRRRRWTAAGAATAVLLTSMVAFSSPASADTSVTVTVSVDYLKQIESPDGTGDFYSVVSIDGETFPRSPRIEDDEFEPKGTPEAPNGWVFSKNVTLSGNNTTVPVVIQIWDYDSGGNGGDDHVDVSPKDRNVDVDLSYDIVTNRWTSSDDLTWNVPCLRGTTPVGQSCATGDGDADFPDVNDGAATRIGFTVSSTVSSSSDSDGDGLSDLAEINGIRNLDGSMALDLPAFGANPRHKDIFLELDHTTGQQPAKADILAMKAAMNAAPVSNPDGFDGIHLWVDTGPLVDTTARKGAATGTCADGIDNGGDGWIDGADGDCTYLDGSAEDPSGTMCAATDTGDRTCLVGDNLGGGGIVAALNNCGVDGTFRAAARNTANFAAVRRGVFRYAISTSKAASCTNGGQASTDNRSFVEYNHDGGTLLHELGHTLGLEHGGFETVNCKPNYVSVLNYHLQGGIPRVGGGRILDYSPPRLALNGSSRGKVPGQLVETALNEGAALDSTDPRNRFVFINGRDQLPGTPGVQGRKVTEDLDRNPDWSGDGANVQNPVVPAVNINTAGPNGRPRNCATNTSSADTLRGFDDWAKVAVSIPFAGFRGLPRQANDESPPDPQPLDDPDLPTRDELDQSWTDLNTTDLGVTITGSPDPVRGGQTLTWTVTATNHGPNPASSPQVDVTLPAEVTYSGSSVPCDHTGLKVHCVLDELTWNAAKTFTITAQVPDDVVHTGAACTITATAVVDNLAGPDSDPSNDTAKADTTVLVTTDLVINGPANVANDSPATLRATLTDARNNPVKDRTVTLTLGSGATAQSCTAVTDASGVAQCVIAVVAQPATATSVALTATFAADGCYLPSDAAGTAKLLYYTGRSYALSLKPALLAQTIVADTGEVSTSAASTKQKTAASVNLLLASANGLTAGVVTGGGVSTGQATTGVVTVGLPGLPVIRATEVRATSVSTCRIGSYTADSAGTVTLGTLTIGGVSQTAGTIAPNTVIHAGVLTITLNEQTPVPGASAGKQVNALHVSAPGVADVVVSSARSDVHNCP
ncbi:MAG: DUF11 domain-containing protein [Nonomuraea sp.]|nr:DUF11 domain-containing protein [Nonomuraea sp.]